MIHIYKDGGAWKDAQGREYTIKAVDSVQAEKLLREGWKLSKDECFTEANTSEDLQPPETADYERKLRTKIKELGGKPAGRAKIDTLEAQLSELENGSN